MVERFLVHTLRTLKLSCQAQQYLDAIFRGHRVAGVATSRSFSISRFAPITFYCPVPVMAETESNSHSSGFLISLILEIVQSPLNIALVTLIGVLVYKIIKSRQNVPTQEPSVPELPKLKKQDFRVSDLAKYDGTCEDVGGRVLVAVNGNVYDVTKGKRFYGPGGPYAAFGGKDASRGLATFSVSASTEEYDDLSDLNTMEMDSVREWEAQFKEKYDLVGRLLKPGEQATNYSDEEEEPVGAGDSKSKDD